MTLVIGAVGLGASSPRFFQAQTQADFLRGELENLSVDTRGLLQLGPATELVYETSAPFLWALTAGSDGSLYMGTGNEGRVFRVDAGGTGTTFFDAEELEAHALATAPDGGLFVGTSPGGQIYKVDRSGTVSAFFDPDQQYIWALAVDGAGVLYVATGDKGIVYRVTPDGVGTPFYEARAANITSLAIDRTGTLFIGTESPGQVLRVDADRKAFVLLDSPFQEIRALRFDEQGILYVAALNGTTGAAVPAPRSDAPGAQPGQAADAPVPTVTVSTEITAVVVDQSPPGVAPQREDRRLARGAIYRIAPDGLWDQVWESREDAPYDLVLDGQRRLIVGTGSQGKIYRLEGDPLQATLVATAGGQQVTALHRDGRGQLYFATANPGKLYRLASAPARRGQYESPPLDAEIVSTWGAIRWRARTPKGARIEVTTRSGNTATPDDTWSEWSAPYPASDGSPVTSPNARYLQWRVVLVGDGESPAVTSVSAAYLQRNLRPQVRSVRLHPPGIVFQKPFSSGDPELAGFEDQTTPERAMTAAAMAAQQGGSSSPSLGRRTYQKGLQTIIWQADDDNGDELSFGLLYRREGDTTWSVLRRDLVESIFVWDTTTVPNGTYFVRVAASDAPSNAPAVALVGEQDSMAFEIDNTAPTVFVETVRSDQRLMVAVFEVRDDHSPIQRVEYSHDGLKWWPVFPVDGIGDSRVERYELAVEGVGPRGLTLRAIDAMNNSGTAQVQVPGR